MNTKQQRQAIIETDHRRYATKKYDPSKHISPADWRTILEVGRLSPSSFGYEPWQFVLIDSDKVKQDIKPFSWGAVNSINGADKLLLILARTDVAYDSDYVARLVRDIKGHLYSKLSPVSQSFKHFQENDLHLASPRARFDWAAKQCYIAMANMMTAAAELGIDSCPIEGFNYRKMNQYLKEHHLADTKHWHAAVMVSFGYRDQPITPKVRQPLADIYRKI